MKNLYPYSVDCPCETENVSIGDLVTQTAKMHVWLSEYVGQYIPLLLTTENNMGDWSHELVYTTDTPCDRYYFKSEEAMMLFKMKWG